MASAPRRTLHAFTLVVAAFLLQCAAVVAAPVEDLRIASDGLWRDTAQADVQQVGERDIIPQRFRLVTLDHAVFQNQFSRAPMESTPGSLAGGVIISLPMPDGDVGRFQIVETAVMAPELAAKFPEIKTWAGKGLDDPAATVFLDSTPQGFHAMVLSPRGRIFIDPYSRNDTANYISYYTRDHISPSRGTVQFHPPDRAIAECVSHPRDLAVAGIAHDRHAGQRGQDGQRQCRQDAEFERHRDEYGNFHERQHQQPENRPFHQ